MAILITLSILTFVFTFIGGVVGIKYKDKLHIILGFTAGVLLAVVAFDIMPEIMEMVSRLSIDPQIPMIALVFGFLVFHIVEKTLLIHHSHETEYGEHKHPNVGAFSAIALAIHSFLDGVGIGLAFQASIPVGIVVAIAVIAHDFSDGLNTVSLMLLHKNNEKRAIRFLFIDAIAPLLGILATQFFELPDKFLIYYLGFFGGFLLYIGASDILPEAHSKNSSWKTIFATIFGVVFIYIINLIIKI